MEDVTHRFVENFLRFMLHSGWPCYTGSMSAASMKLLVVEDDADLRRVVVKLLEAEGYQVDACSDGEEGLYKSQNWDYDAIILDVMLPEIDGFSLLRRLRKSRNTPVLMLTARDGMSDRVQGLDLGADDYLTKPFETEELLARVRAVVRRGGLRIERCLQVGDVVLDTAAMTVSLKGEPVELTAREFALAEQLMRRRGEVISREAIYENLFDENDETVSNMLDVYIYKLRQKLGTTFIRTKRGSGYYIL